MSIQVEWDNEDHRIIRFDYDDKWTWADHFAAVQQSVAMMKTVDHTVDMIINLENSSHLPPNALTNIRSTALKGTPNWRITVLVGMNTFAQLLMNMFGKINKDLGQHFVAVDTMEEAYALIADRRAKDKD
jgi:hypothetical protein